MGYTDPKLTPGKNAPPDFIPKVLLAIGAPVTWQNVLVLQSWFNMEAGDSGNNPMNTTLDKPYAHTAQDFNSVGVKNYLTEQDGINATAATLLDTHYHRYDAVVASLRQGTVDPRTTARLVNNSPWVTGKANDPKLAGNKYVWGEVNGALQGNGGPNNPFVDSAKRIAGGDYTQAALPGSSIMDGITPADAKKYLTNPISSVGDFLSKITDPSFWLRVGEFVLGVAMVLVGIMLLARKSVPTIPLPVGV